MNLSEDQVYEFGPFRLDPKRRTFEENGEPRKLTEKPFNLLHHLVSAQVNDPGIAIPKKDLLDGTWHDGLRMTNDALKAVFKELYVALNDKDRENRIYIVRERNHTRFVAKVLRVNPGSIGPPPLRSSQASKAPSSLRPHPPHTAGDSAGAPPQHNLHLLEPLYEAPPALRSPSGTTPGLKLPFGLGRVLKSPFVAPLPKPSQASKAAFSPRPHSTHANPPSRNITSPAFEIADSVSWHTFAPAAIIMILMGLTIIGLIWYQREHVIPAITFEILKRIPPLSELRAQSMHSALLFCAFDVAAYAYGICATLFVVVFFLRAKYTAYRHNTFLVSCQLVFFFLDLLFFFVLAEHFALDELQGNNPLGNTPLGFAVWIGLWIAPAVVFLTGYDLLEWGYPLQIVARPALRQFHSATVEGYRF